MGTPSRQPDPYGLITARSRVDHRAAVLVHVACAVAEVASSAPVREASARVAGRLLGRGLGSVRPEAGARWAREDLPTERWVREAAFAVGAPLVVAAAIREELPDGWVEARADPEGRVGTLVAVRTTATMDRALPLLAELCLHPSTLPSRHWSSWVQARAVRRLGMGTELSRAIRLSVGTAAGGG